MFTLDDIKEGDKMFRFYAGLPDYIAFKLLLKSFGDSAYKLVLL